MWVQFDSQGETGTYFTLYSVENRDKPINKRIIVQAQNNGVLLNLFDDLDQLFVQFPSHNDNVQPITDGQWHHLALTWDGSTGEVVVTLDSIIDRRSSYGQGNSLPQYGYVTLGSYKSSEGRTRTESGFHGKLNKVQVWNRVLSEEREIPNQVRSYGGEICKNAPILFDGL